MSENGARRAGPADENLGRREVITHDDATSPCTKPGWKKYQDDAFADQATRLRVEDVPIDQRAFDVTREDGLDDYVIRIEARSWMAAKGLGALLFGTPARALPVALGSAIWSRGLTRSAGNSEVPGDHVWQSNEEREARLVSIGPDGREHGPWVPWHRVESNYVPPPPPPKPEPTQATGA